MSDHPEDEDRTVYQPKGTVPPKREPEDIGMPPLPPAPEQAATEPPVGSPPPPPPPPPPASPPAKKGDRQLDEGEVLNGIYKIKQLIARGGMGEVYEATNVHSPSERVAVKIMLQHLAQDELVAAMFAKEAEMLTRLHHEAIMQYRLSARDAEGRPYIVTEFIDGPSLEEKLGELKLSEEELATMAQKLAAGLGTAHTLGAIHRDIAPDNILLADGDPARPKIIDFGIAKDAREQSGTIVGDGFAGKLKYVAPEQLGEYGRNVGPWSDIYSLALTLRAVAAGKHSDMGGSLADAVRKRLSVPDLSALPPRFHPAFEMALQPDPANRPQSMAEFILRLTECFSQDGGPGFAPIDDSTAFKPTQAPASGGDGSGGIVARLTSAFPSGLAENKIALIGGGIAAVLLLVVGLVVITSIGGGEEQPTTPVQADGGGTTEPEAPTQPARIEVGSPQFARLAQQAAASVDCAWLSFDGARGSTASFKGGAANPAAAQTSLIAGLRSAGATVPTLDFSNVQSFPSSACPVIDALSNVRSPQTLISSPQSVYEARTQEIPLKDGGAMPSGKYAKFVMSVSNIPPNRDYAMIQIENNDGVQPLFADRAEAENFVEAFLGDVNSGGFNVPFPAPFEGSETLNYGIFVISSPNKLPAELVNVERDPRFDANWAQQFSQNAQANGWTVDAMWFSVEDKQPD